VFDKLIKDADDAEEAVQNPRRIGS